MPVAKDTDLEKFSIEDAKVLLEEKLKDKKRKNPKRYQANAKR